MWGKPKGSKKRELRIYFATDIHGSEVCFRKFLAAARVYQADVIILGGDFAGKAIVPVLTEDGTLRAPVAGEDVTVPEPEWDRLAADIGKAGLYPVRMEHRAECTEDELAKQIGDMLDPLPDGRPCLLNLHCPPYASGLDDAPELDATLKPVIRGGRPSIVPVGSRAVRDAIKRYQPVVGLHGHIHESRGAQKIGRTLCVNPGSDYSSGRCAAP
jgi:Icc-related predicted phosphoesterase